VYIDGEMYENFPLDELQDEDVKVEIHHHEVNDD